MRGHSVANGAISILTNGKRNIAWSRADIDARGLSAVAAEIAAEAGAAAEECFIVVDGNGDFRQIMFGQIPASDP